MYVETKFPFPGKEWLNPKIDLKFVVINPQFSLRP